MQNSKYLLILFALLALQAFCIHADWNNSAFSIPPRLLKSVGLEEPIISLRLATGSGTQKNLLNLEYPIGRYRISELMILNSTELAIIQESTNHVARVLVESLDYASNGSYTFGAIAVLDQLAIAVYKNDTANADIFQVTNSTGNDTYLKVLQLIAYGNYPIAILLQVQGDNMTLNLGVIDPAKRELKQMLNITAGVNITDVRCDSDLLSNNVLCLYKMNGTVYRAFIPLNSSSSLTNDQLHADIPHGMKQVKYIPQKVVGTKDGFVYFLLSQTPDGSMMQGHIADTSGFLGVTYSQGIHLKSFSSHESSPLRGALLYGDGFATFQRDMNASGKTQVWSYTIYNNDLSVKQDEITFAEVPEEKSDFKVARDFDSGAINVAAHTFTVEEAKVELSIFYGQLLSEISEEK